MCKQVELLSPAGSMEAAKAALANGADALYLGAASFGARSSAGFDEVSLHEIIDLAHLHRRRIHVTLNTLIKENEFDNVDKTLQLLSKLKADAILVQDLGLMRHIRQFYPEFELHLSTQMAIHNAAGARFAIQNGADRVVLARECDLPTIRSVCETGIDTEVFVHGALCVCLSGQCLLSSSIGGRSGNRGRCAQPCRLEYEYLNQKGAWLSPRDICLRDYIPELLKAGVASLKIEGRLKRPEYVAVVTRAYRTAIDAYYNGRFTKASPEELHSLRQIFSRGGFSSGYPFASEDAGIIYSDRVKPEGTIIGKTINCTQVKGATLCTVHLAKDLHNGDGLEINHTNVIYSGPDQSADQLVQIRVHDAIPSGKDVRLMDDERQLKQARQTYEGSALDHAAPIEYDLEFTAYPGSATRITAKAGGVSVSLEGPIAENALRSELNEDLIRRSFSKTGGTPFILRKMLCHTKDAFLTAGALNQMRKAILDQLSSRIIEAGVNKEHIFCQQDHRSTDNCDIPSKRELYVLFEDTDIAYSLLEAGADRLIYAPTDYHAEVLDQALSTLPNNTYVALPEYSSNRVLNETIRMIEAHHLGIAFRNAGQLSLKTDSRAMSLDMVPLFNQRTADFLFNSGCSCITLSPELSLSEIKQLRLSPRFLLTVHGRQRLMTLTHCPYRTKKGFSSGHADCRLCYQGTGAKGTCLTLRKGASYPLHPLHSPDGCRIELRDYRAKDLSPLQDELRLINVSFLVDVTGESPEEAKNVVKTYRSMLEVQRISPCRGYFTEGRIKTGVL